MVPSVPPSQRPHLFCQSSLPIPSLAAMPRHPSTLQRNAKKKNNSPRILATSPMPWKIPGTMLRNPKGCGTSSTPDVEHRWNFPAGEQAHILKLNVGFFSWTTDDRSRNGHLGPEPVSLPHGWCIKKPLKPSRSCPTWRRGHCHRHDDQDTVCDSL